MGTITTIELAKEAQLTPKSIRQAIERDELRATRLGRGRMQQTFVIQREDADTWIRWRAERKVKRALPPRRTGGRLRVSRPEQTAFFPNRDDETMHNGDQFERWKGDALRGDVDARLRLKLPWEQGGMQVVKWWNREAGTII
jgi:hypothetical protein